MAMEEESAPFTSERRLGQQKSDGADLSRGFAKTEMKDLLRRVQSYSEALQEERRKIERDDLSKDRSKTRNHVMWIAFNLYARLQQKF
jgi:hypothetical protein